MFPAAITKSLQRACRLLTYSSLTSSRRIKLSHKHNISDSFLILWQSSRCLAFVQGREQSSKSTTTSHSPGQGIRISHLAGLLIVVGIGVTTWGLYVLAVFDTYIA